MWEAHKDETPLWKSSSMATLSHGLDSNSRKTLDRCILLSQMSREAEEVKVRLSKNADGGEYSCRILPFFADQTSDTISTGFASKSTKVTMRKFEKPWG